LTTKMKKNLPESRRWIVGHWKRKSNACVFLCPSVYTVKVYSLLTLLPLKVENTVFNVTRFKQSGRILDSEKTRYVGRRIVLCGKPGGTIIWS
jgi:hypothetical protein